jgi:hypothetical protein
VPEWKPFRVCRHRPDEDGEPERCEEGAGKGAGNRTGTPATQHVAIHLIFSIQVRGTHKGIGDNATTPPRRYSRTECSMKTHREGMDQRIVDLYHDFGDSE